VSAEAPTDPAPAPAAADAGEPGWKVVGERVGTFVLAPLAELGMLARMLFETVFWLVRPPYRVRLLIEQMEFIGVGSVFLVSLTGFFIGAVLGLQLVDGFRQFGAENQTGAVVGIAMAREMGPVFTALMISSRAGSAMTTELGSMRVSDQINALVVLAVNPVQYLIVPRVLAGVITAPILTLLFNVVGLTGAYLVCVHMLGIDPGIFLGRMQWLVDWPDVAQGLTKAAIFGGTISLIACRQGFYATGGAAGVGRATNRSVVHNAIAILALDYLVTAIILGQGLF
jgi:phospholipid/cholesterol/gamma-HCH transport system permease protein